MYKDEENQCPIQNYGQNPQFEKQVLQEYKNEIRKKEVEITQLQRSLLKDSMRIAFQELGQIHYQYGYIQEAIKAWNKSHDFCNSPEDLFNIAYQIAVASYEIQNYSYLVKFSGEADARDKQKNQAKTMIVKILDGLSAIIINNFKQASFKLSQVQLVEDPIIYTILTPEDLAYYITICCLNSDFSRKEIKDLITENSQFNNQMEIFMEIIENFLNGKYKEFQQQLSVIQRKLKYDMYFGYRIDSIIENIRKKALIQFVTPYKVIEIKEIAKEFNLSVDQIQDELAQLIVNQQIQAKIDSHSKLLYSKKENATLNSCKEAALLGRQFLQETERQLLKIQLLKQQKVLQLNQLST